MTVHWDGTMADGSPNRFAAKHLHIVSSTYSVAAMEAEGLRILRERNSFVAVQNKKQKYGQIKPSANTLIVTNIGGKKELDAWVEKYVPSTGTYEIPLKVGVIVQNYYETMMECNFFFVDAKVGGSFKAKIDVTGTDKRVFHMEGVQDEGIVLRDFKMSTGGVAFTV